MSDSQPSDLPEEELASAPVGLETEASDSVEDATTGPVDESGELNPAVQSDVQQAGAEGEAPGNRGADAEGLPVEHTEGLQQEAEVERPGGTLNVQDASSSVQQDVPPDSSLAGAANEATEYVSASIDPTVEAEQDGDAAEMPLESDAFQLDSTGASSRHTTDAEQFSSAAGGSYAAQQQLVPGALASALANPELDPDHPLLARAQKALSKQLLAIKDQLEAEVREKAVALQHAKTRREAIGVELYNFQQQLAKMQMQLEKAQENYVHISQIRRQAEEQLQSLQRTHAEEEQLMSQERLKVEKVQRELDGLAATLKQVELYNEQMKGEIAVTRRATYAAEQSVQKLEKGKKEQDLLIDHLHQQVRTQEQQIAVYTQQYEAQRRESRAAKEMLAGAEAEMEGIHFEKKQLTAQWQSSLVATQRRDQALRALEDAITEQHEQERSIENEIEAYRKDIVREQIRNEQLTAVMTKLEGESGFLRSQNDTMVKKQEKLQETYLKLQHELSLAEEKLRKAHSQGKLLEADRKTLDKGIAKANNSIKAVEAKVLDNLSEQTTAEKSAFKTAQDIKSLRKQVYDEEMVVVQLQNDLAKLEVDVLHTQGHNLRLEQAMKLLNDDINEKIQTIGKYEADLKRRADELEKKTAGVDVLNRKADKIRAAQDGGPETGPLEAVVNNLTREIQGKGEEGRQLQRRWVGWQTELVEVAGENNRLAQDLQRLKASHTITHHKRTRLRQQHDVVQREVKELEKGIAHLHNCMARYNALIADNADLKVQLVNDNFHLETKIGHELQDMEEAAAALSHSIDASRKDKGQLLADIVDTEKQVMLWQRKIELEREMNDVLDPSVGGDVVGAMKKEIHRMQLRAAELSRIQESLLLDMERSITKRDTIALKGRAATMKKIPDITEQALKKALGELERSIRDTKRESRATDERVACMDSQRAQLADEVASAHYRVDELQRQEGEIRAAMEAAGNDKHKALLMTSGQQKIAKCYEDIDAGRYRNRVSPSIVDAELRAAKDKQQNIVAAITASIDMSVEMRPALERILIRSAALAGNGT